MPIYTFAPGALANLVDPRHTRTNHVLFIGWDSFRVTYTGLLPFDTMDKLETYLLMQSQYETKPIAFNWVLNMGIGPPLGFAMNCNGVQWRPTSKFGGTLYPQLNDVQRVPEPKFIAVSLRVYQPKSATSIDGTVSWASGTEGSKAQQYIFSGSAAQSTSAETARTPSAHTSH